MNKKAKKELKEKEIYVRFEKLAKRLRKERKELDANEFWKFLILELDQAITKARNEVLEEVEKKLPWKIHNVSEKEVVWNQYRNKVISILKSLNKEK